ncbi:hypothetical protein Tco_0490959 [Tanacetum coccineum]
MSNFLKNQGIWKLTQLKKLNFEEVKAEFEKLIKQLDTYVPINLEATKESLKRFDEELQTKTAKKLKFDDESTQPTEEKVKENRDDLTELYKIVMRKHGMNEPEDEFEKVLWEYLKNMFEEPLSTNSIWSLPGQQRLICWRYYEAYRVHCLNLESVDIYMLIERKYPLSTEVCKAMLDKKLQEGKPDEDCYKLLKMMEKQAGIRK